MMGPRERVLGLIDGAWTTQAIAAACSLRLFDALAEAPLDAASLAARLDAERDPLERLAKALCTLGLCERGGDGRFELAEAGQCLRRDADRSLHGWARMAGSRLWANWSCLEQAVRTGHSAREMRGHDDFTEMDKDPHLAGLFNAAMVDLTRPVAEAAAASLDWSGVHTLVDVGGGTGALAAGILERHASLRGIVCDLAHARPSAEAWLAAKGLSSRCRFEPCDFFCAVPAGGDAYVLKSVLHNWPDARAAEILAACRRAIAPKGRLVVLERLEPAQPGPDAASREVARSDLNMLVGCGGRERTEAEYRALLSATGFDPVAATALVNGFWAMEARPRPTAA